MSNTSLLSYSAKKRIFLDTKELFKNPLTSMGIYYKNNIDDLSVGYAMIIGPKDTPYQYGYYLFEIKYPCNYPFEPPHVLFLTNDGKTRFNPNLYKEGKVCLSILNTWDGPSWSPCQTIRSVLISILGNVFVDNPICNEPGFNITNKENEPYNQSIRYKNIEFACLQLYMKTTKIKNKAYDLFYPIIQDDFNKNYENIKEYALKCCNTFNNNEKIHKSKTKIIRIEFYNMKTYIDYETLINTIVNIKV